MEKPRIRLVELLAEKSIQEGRIINNMTELEGEVGIERRRLYTLRDNTAKSIKPEEIKALCDYFNCTVDDLIEYTPPLTHGQEQMLALMPA